MKKHLIEPGLIARLFFAFLPKKKKGVFFFIPCVYNVLDIQKWNYVFIERNTGGPRRERMISHEQKYRP